MALDLGIGLGLRARNGGQGAPAPMSLSDVTGLIFAHDASNDGKIATADGAVSVFANEGAYERTLTQGVGAFQPTHNAASDVIAFDGSNDYLAASETATATLADTHALPDAQGGDVGEGFTCTGLARDPDGSWWVGNHGGDVQGGSTPTPSLVHLSGDFSTVIAELDLETIYSSAVNSCQGVAYDTSDDTLWFADVLTGKVYHITKAGVPIPADTITLTAANGCAYDALRDRLWVFEQSTNTLKEYDASDQSLLRTVTTGLTSIDHIFYDAAQWRMWMTREDGTVRLRDVNETLTAAKAIASYTVSAADSIEGVCIVGDKMYLCNDGYFHSGSPPENRILEYDIDHVFGGSLHTDTVLLFGVIDRPSTQSSPARVLMVIGEPTEDVGLGLYFPTDSNDLRLIANSAAGTSERDILDFDTDTTAEMIFCMEIDYTSANATLYVDGTQVGSSQSLANLADRPLLGSYVLGWSDDASGSRYSNTQLKCIGAAHALDQREEVEGILAWKYGEAGVARLPGGHPYKSAAPAL